MRKNQLSMEQLQTDYNTEKSSVVKLEGQRSMLERQNKELKAKLAELEAEVRSKTKATIAALESKVGFTCINLGMGRKVTLCSTMI